MGQPFMDVLARNSQPLGATFVEVLRWRALHHPDKMAYTFLLDGETREERCTYAGLDERARQVAALLQEHLAPGDRVLLLYPPGLEYITAIFGCWYAGVVAVPAYPPRLNQNLTRIEGIIQDADAHAALTTPAILSGLQRKFTHDPLVKGLCWLVPEHESIGSAERWKEYSPTRDTLALLQYTSGSTGTPKGVMITHDNLIQNAVVVQNAMSVDSRIFCVGWLPTYHDMGLMGLTLEPLYLGGSSILMAPASFLLQPMRWLQAITHFKANTSGAPNFAFDLCVDKATPEALASLDLSNWDTVFVGSEPIQAETLERFYRTFAPCGLRKEAFYPCYGMAEATLFISGGLKQEPPIVRHFARETLEQNRPMLVGKDDGEARQLVGCGRPQPEQQVLIVDPVSQGICAPQQVGEIWVAGPNVAQGYWRKPRETQETFQAFLKESHDGPFLRTGDLGFFSEGELFVTGRFKDLIIIRGQNYYPQDIENAAELSHQALRRNCSAAFSVEVDGEERVILVMEIERQYRQREPQELFAAIRQAVLEEHNLHVYAIVLIKPGSILKTSSGKIQHRACREAFLSRTLAVLFADLPHAVIELLGQHADMENKGAMHVSQTKQIAQSDKMVSRQESSSPQDDVPISKEQQTGENRATQHISEDRNMQFSLLYFSSNGSEFTENAYELLLEGAKFADQHDFTAVWVPERHFHPFGGLYPNPSVLASALAVTTQKIRLRAGSVVLPLHHLARVAEEWSIVDNLSSGRVDIAFATGWNPNDFVLAPTQYTNRKPLLFSGIETFQKLWRGDSITWPNGLGKETAIKIYPRPKQSQLTPWITCTSSPERFSEAGAMGANVLTGLLFQSLEELAEKINAYRQARAQHGYDPASGHVTLMVHTFIGEEIDEVRQKVRQPFMEYLKSSVDLWRNSEKRLSDLEPQEQEQVLSYAFERYFQTHALFGTPQTASKMVDRFKEIGVDEIACLIDFGIDTDLVMDSLYLLNTLRKRCQKGTIGRAKRMVEPIDTAEPKEMPTPMPTSLSVYAEPEKTPGEKAIVHDTQEQSFIRQLNQCSQDERLMLIEQYIQQKIAQVVGRNSEEISSVLNIRGLGLDSLMVVNIVNNCQRDLLITLDAGQFYERTSFKSLALYIAEEFNRAYPNREGEKLTRDMHAMPQRRGQQTVFPASFAQQRLWFMHQLQPHMVAYNVPSVLEIKGDLAVDALEWSLNEIIRRHESLRTSFTIHEGRPVQVINETTAFALFRIELNDLNAGDREFEKLRLARLEGQYPFDLTQGPLIRATLLLSSSHEYILLLTYHHVVMDGWSRGILLQELRALYKARIEHQPSLLEELPIQYVDFTLWQRQWLHGPGKTDTVQTHVEQEDQEWNRESRQNLLEKQLAYWKTQLADPLSILKLPTDYPRPAVQTFHGAHLLIHLPEDLMEGLEELSRREEVTLFMTLLASFQVLLARYSGQEDIPVGTSIAGRNRAEIEQLIGLFVNTLVLRTNLSGNPSFLELLQRVSAVCRGAYAHQDAPFEQVVDAVHPERDPSRYPLFQVMFMLQQASWWLEAELPGASLRQLPSESGISPFDLSWSITSQGFGEIEYNTDLFTAATIERMLSHWQMLLHSIVAGPQLPISELSFIPLPEREKLLVKWNQTRSPYLVERTIHQFFEAQVLRTPDAVALCYEDLCLTYAQLNYRANQLARVLQKLGVRPEVQVGLCLVHSLELIIGLLGILKAGGAYVPLDPHLPEERLAFMLEELPILLTQERWRERLPIRPFCLEHCLDKEWELIAAESGENLSNVVNVDNLAYVIYTSGSTGKPKGVLVSHRGIANLMQAQKRHLGVGVGSRVLQFSTPSFDAFVWEIVMALLTGATLCIGTRESIQPGSDLHHLLQEKYITIMTLPPSALSVMPTDGVATVETIVTAGEACTSDLVELWAPGRRFFNAYGPTEATVCATVTACTAGSNAKPTIGGPLSNIEVYMLDAHMQPVPIGVPGELFIGGISLARGYLNQPALTAERFIPHPFSTEAGARLYRTGDLARYLADGTIDFLGRIDYQVKVRGFRIELGEIEVSLAAHPDVRDCIVLAREDVPGDKRLVAYLVPHTSESPALSIPDLRAFLQERLPAYMVPSTYVLLTALPLTLHGKIDRRALPPPDYEVMSETTYVAPHTPTEEVVARLWAQVLGLERVGVHDNFFDLGGHSLLVTQIISRIREHLHVEIPLGSLFETPSVAGLTVQIEQMLHQEEAKALPLLVPASREQDLPLSFAQERLWFLQQLEPENISYHIPAAYRLTGPLSVKAFEHSLKCIVERHEILRTTFYEYIGRPIQIIAPSLCVQVPVIDLCGIAAKIRANLISLLTRQEFTRSFDLAAGPLVRISFIRIAEHEHLLLFTMHHIIADGWSASILIQELNTFYQAYLMSEASVALPALPIQYADYALWQRQWLRDEMLQEQLGYWRQHLLDAPTLLHLPLDRPRPALQTHVGATQTMLLSTELQQALQTLSQQEDTTLFMTLLAAFQVLLMRYTGEQDLVVGTPIAHRTRIETEHLIGFFVNTLALRTDLSGNPSFRQLLARVREVALQAYAHQDLPFERLVEELRPVRSLGYTPFFQVLFVLQNVPTEAIRLHDLTLQPLEIKQSSTKFDLTLQVQESEQGLWTTIEYNTDLFDTSTIERMLTHWQMLLRSIVANPFHSISALPYISMEEEQKLLGGWRITTAKQPEQAQSQRIVAQITELEETTALHQAFERQVKRTPDALALVFEEEALTYSQLNRRANQLAHHLQQLGVGHESFVGLCLHRSLDLLIGLLGILKAGGAYVPLDPTYPPDRLAFLATNAHLPVVVTSSDQRAVTRLIKEGTTLLCLDEDAPLLAQQPSDDLHIPIFTEQVAYCLYTSGSTGMPKGVMVTHQNVLRLFAKTQDWYRFQAGDIWSLFHSYAFDFSVWEIWGAFLYGGCLVVIPHWVSRAFDSFYHVLTERGVTILNQTPSAFQQLTRVEEMTRGESNLSLRLVIFGGEALELESLQSWVRRHGERQPQLVNMYGITETTVHVTYRPLFLSDVMVNTGSLIGEAIPDLQLYILDDSQRLVPIGVPGELYVGGMGLARGYFQQPSLTAERFIPHPWSLEPGVRLYRTGDLVRYRADGDIEYLGRVDQQVKLRGFRIELGEIEATLRMHQALQEAVVLLREDVPGDKRLVAYVVSRTGGEVPIESEIGRYLHEKLPEYMVPGSFVTLAALPLNSNGKVDRRALPVPGKRVLEAAQIVAARTPLEEIVLGIYCDVLGVEQISIRESFFDLGGHSLLATQIISRIRRLMHIEIPLRSLFETPSVAGLALQIEYILHREEATALPPLVAVSRMQDLPLSFAQERLWFLQRLEPENISYNIPAAYRLTGPLSVENFERCFQEIVQRHESLRTTFELRSEQPVQVINAHLRIDMPVIDLVCIDESKKSFEVSQWIRAAMLCPFDLSHGPLLRIGVLHVRDEEYIFYIVMHHILFDAWSTNIFLHELLLLYKAFVQEEPFPLATLSLHYADFAFWQRNCLKGETLNALVDYWAKQLQGAVPLELPTDRPRTKAVSDRGAVYTFKLPASLTQEIVALSRQEGVTLFMTLLTAFQVLLMRSTGEQDLVVGTDIANRTVIETEEMIGFFVNLLVLRIQLGDQATFSETLKSVCTMVLDAYAHQNLPFEKLIDALQLTRGSYGVPLVNVLFVLQNVPPQPLELPRLTVHPLNTEVNTAKFDIALFLVEDGSELLGSVNYRTDLFDVDTIARLLHRFEVLLQNSVIHPDIPIEALEMFTEEEKEQKSREEDSYVLEKRNKLKSAKRHKLVPQEIENKGIK